MTPADFRARRDRVQNREHRLVALVGAGHLPVFGENLPELGLRELDYTGTVTGTAVVPER